MTNDFSCFFLIPHFLGQISMHIPMNALFFSQKFFYNLLNSLK